MLKKLGPRKTLGILCFINLITCGIVACFAQPFQCPYNEYSNGIRTRSQQALRYSAGTGVLLLALNNGTASSPGAAIGHIADKIGHQNTLSISMVITFSTWILWLIGAKTGTKCMWFTFVLHGLAGGAFPTLYSNVIIQLFGYEMYLASTGTFGCTRGVGYLVSIL